MPRVSASLLSGLLLMGLSSAPAEAGALPKKAAEDKPVAAKTEAKPAPVHANPVEGRPPPIEGLEPAKLPGEEEMIKAEETALASYMIGFSVGKQLEENLKYVSFPDFLAGLKDAKDGKEPAADKEESMKAMRAFHADMKARQAAEAKAVADANKKIGEAYYNTQKIRPGVKATPSGLLYEVEKPGEGESPKATDKVTVHYEGTLVDGTVFDSSYKRGQPTSFPLNGVIKGWTEGLQLMKPGAKYRFVLPPSLAYGSRGAGPDIGPDATLTFVVELIKVADPATSKPTLSLPGHGSGDGHGHSHGPGDGHGH